MVCKETSMILDNHLPKKTIYGNLKGRRPGILSNPLTGGKCTKNVNSENRYFGADLYTEKKSGWPK